MQSKPLRLPAPLLYADPIMDFFPSQAPMADTSLLHSLAKKHQILVMALHPDHPYPASFQACLRHYSLGLVRKDIYSRIQVLSTDRRRQFCHSLPRRAFLSTSRIASSSPDSYPSFVPLASELLILPQLQKPLVVATDGIGLGLHLLVDWRYALLLSDCARLPRNGSADLQQICAPYAQLGQTQTPEVAILERAWKLHFHPPWHSQLEIADSRIPVATQ
mmetsp:Transcript_108846/g.171638  ORF Transcript_108846/g.171638 Transcript_108846/m.171638 type:complete len:219 (+) Transcript_108846:208-864(+)